mmetsp:Transcript_95187/g.266555  ORF Transcript_95187/g.266555 Transcript_95187/m.266555 type:complete len:105 (+) Transcript_95187:203-517(+)
MSAEAWREYKQAYDEDVAEAASLGYYQLRGHDCWSSNASSPMSGWEQPLGSAADCGRACAEQAHCDGFIYGRDAILDERYRDQLHQRPSVPAALQHLEDLPLED